MKRRAIQVVDLGFGDAGKGSIVDYLVRRNESDLVVRFNGGPQAGHNVVLPDGRHHTFSQFGAGSFVPFTRTLLSRFMLIEPYAMLREASHLDSIGVHNALACTLIDERCLVITPPQQVANRIRERARQDQAHGTCGMGVGECVADSIDHPDLALLAGELADRRLVASKLRAILESKRDALASVREFATADESRVLDDAGWIDVAADACAQVAKHASIVSQDQANSVVRRASCCIFEGAQGVLLDERHGFHPHTTWSKTTFCNADALLDESQSDCERFRLGVMRTYMTRHGTGPFVTEHEEPHERLPELHNGDDGWQGRFRVGSCDLVALRYALEVCGDVHGLGVTHLDRLGEVPAMVCDAYRCGPAEYVRLPAGVMSAGTLKSAEPCYRVFPTGNEASFIDALERALNARVVYRSRGATYLDKD